MYKTLGGRVECRQCDATSKRTKERCKAPAIKGKSKCRFHGGLSTGPKTEHGKQRTALAKTVHGRETRAKRENHSRIMSELRVCEDIAYLSGLYPVGTPRLVGRKPKGYPHNAGEYSELLELTLEKRREAVEDILKAHIIGG